MKTVAGRVLILSSSGGSGHEQGAESLQQILLQEGHSLEHITKIDVMNSFCTGAPAFGRFCSGLWDEAQRTGNVTRQRLLIQGQWLFDKICFFFTYFYVKRLLLSPKHKPNRVILTSPLFLSAICSAVYEANQNSKEKIIIDLYMTEPPTEKALHFFDPIRSLSKKHKSLIQMHVQKPSQYDLELFKGEENYWNAKTGLSLSQIIHSSPVKTLFQNSENLPTPGSVCTIKIRSSTSFPIEQAFLRMLAEKREECRFQEETGECAFSIKEKDKVCLLMLGGIPTKQAILDYVKEALKLASKMREQEGSFSAQRNYFFVSCGSPSSGLYEEVCKELQNNTSPSLIVVPFTKQPIEHIFARADMTITRSGGMTSLELLALKKNRKRKDLKKVLIHSEVKSSILSKEEFSYRKKEKSFLFSSAKKTESLFQDYNAYLIQKWIPLWEGSNAEYLMKEIAGVEIVTAKMVSSYFQNVFFPFAEKQNQEKSLEQRSVRFLKQMALSSIKKRKAFMRKLSFFVSGVIVSTFATFFYFTDFILASSVFLGTLGLGYYVLFMKEEEEAPLFFPSYEEKGVSAQKDPAYLG